jgi:hypothetical protein
MGGNGILMLVLMLMGWCGFGWVLSTARAAGWGRWAWGGWDGDIVCFGEGGIEDVSNGKVEGMIVEGGLGILSFRLEDGWKKYGRGMEEVFSPLSCRRSWKLIVDWLCNCRESRVCMCYVIVTEVGPAGFVLRKYKTYETVRR